MRGQWWQLLRHGRAGGLRSEPGHEGRAAPVARATPSTHRGRLIAVALVVGLLLVTLVGRLGQLQVLDLKTSQHLAAKANTRTLVLPAVRGRILDRHGTPLATNTVSMSVTLDRRQWVRDERGTRSTLEALARVIGRDAKDVVGRAQLCGEAGAPSPPTCWNGSPQALIPVASGVDPTKALTLLERPDLHPGLGIETTPVRSYPAPQGANLAHVLGYLGHVTDAEVAASDGRIDAFALIGRTGLEAQYDAELRGTPGAEVVSVDPRGLVTGTISRTEPIPGKDLMTSLDAGIQATTEAALAAAIASARSRDEVADSAAAVVLDVRTGAVVAAASAPSYDPNVWTGGISSTAYASLTDPTSGLPLLSRIDEVALAPASTIKALSVPAAVAAGNALDGRFACPASYQIGDRAFHNYESTAHGDLGFADALRVSCDTIFYDAAYRNWLAMGGVGATSDADDPFVATDLAFGLGRVTGIDLPGEAKGTVPGRFFKEATWTANKAELCTRATTGYPELAATDPERAEYLTTLARENCATGFQFRAGDAANLSIGQGELAATPLQMAVVYAAVATGGTLVTPRIAQGWTDSVTGVTAPLPRLATRSAGLDPSVAELVRTGLRAVVTSGTGAGAFAGMREDWPVSGKTGTAEVLGKGDTSWFVSWAPSGTPEQARYAVAVVVTQGGTGAETAAPAARAIHEALAASGLRPAARGYCARGG